MKKILSTSIPASLILLWCYAAFSKLFALRYFTGQLATHRLFEGHEKWVAWTVPLAELAIAFLLLWPAGRRWGLILSIALLTVFSGYILYMFRFYPHTPCTCGGVISGMGWRTHIVFNLAFICLSIAGLFLDRTDKNRPD